jgi:hypothetical protein
MNRNEAHDLFHAAVRGSAEYIAIRDVERDEPDYDGLVWWTATAWDVEEDEEIHIADLSFHEHWPEVMVEWS